MKLVVPKLSEYAYEQKLLSDVDTMSYNAGFNVDYNGYDYNTGCIDFPKDKWQEKYNKRQNSDVYFAYIEVDNNYVGYVNYNRKHNNASIGIVIEAKHRKKDYSDIALKLLIKKASEDGITTLTDDYESTRNAHKLFEGNGFKISKSYYVKKFNQDVEIIEVKKNIEI